MSAEIKTTTCYMCACRCGIRVHLRDGAVRYIEGNPEHPLNKGVICAKGSSGIMKQVSPARLTRPLKRKAGAQRLGLADRLRERVGAVVAVGDDADFHARILAERR